MLHTSFCKKNSRYFRNQLPLSGTTFFEGIFYSECVYNKNTFKHIYSNKKVRICILSPPFFFIVCTQLHKKL